MSGPLPDVTGDPLVDELAAACPGRVEADASLARLTTLRVGGRARALVVAESLADLAAVAAAAAAHGVEVAVVGRGSNLLVADEGWPGLAVQLGRGFRGVEFADEEVRAGAAEPLPTLAAQVAEAGLAGFAWAAAVPGTVGGAVRMNAGAHEGEMSEHLVEVEVFRLGTAAVETWPVAALEAGYRRSALPGDAVVVAARLRLPPGDVAVTRTRIEEIRAWRRAHQPLNEPNCGSVFTNPAGDAAGRLIEAAGLKGHAVGGARISERHANFVVTRPGASAADVHALIRLVVRRVEERTGVVLHPEVTLLGRFGEPERVP